MSEHPDQKLENAYNTMMQRVQEALAHTGDGAETVGKALQQARDRAIELGELTDDQADQVSDWVRRDLQQAGRYMADTGHDLGDWLHMDLEMIELSLLDLFTSVADKTRLEMLQLEEDLTHMGEYRSGEVAGPGTLECRECGELLRFTRPGHIPPCPRCHNTAFSRYSR